LRSSFVACQLVVGGRLAVGAASVGAVAAAGRQALRHAFEQFAAADDVNFGVHHRLVEVDRAQPIGVGRLQRHIGTRRGDQHLAGGDVSVFLEHAQQQPGERHEQKEHRDQTPPLEDDVQDLADLLVDGQLVAMAVVAIAVPLLLCWSRSACDSAELQLPCDKTRRPV
jgi:hypothetical protein